MHAGIDFLAQDLLGTLHRQRGDLITQHLAGLDALLLSFGVGSGDDFRALCRCFALGFFDHGVRTSLGLRQTHSRLVARLGKFFFNALVGHGEFRLGLVGSSQAFGDLAGTFVQSSRDGRPHEFHREQDQQCEDDSLRYQSSINVHS